MNSSLCRRCHSTLQQGGNDMHHTTSPINQFTLIGPNPAFPFSVPPNDAGYPGLAPGAGWWPYAPAGGSMMGTMAGFPWVPLAGSPFLLPPSYPVPGFFPALGAYVGAPSEDNQELFPQLETAADESFPFVEKSAPGLQLSDDSPGALSGAPPSIYSVPSPIPDHYLQIIPPVPPTDAPLTYRCPEPGCTKAFKKACSLKQHERTHTRPEVCRHCVRDDGTPVRFADKKSLRRHTVAKHAAVLEAAGTAGPVLGSWERRACPYPGCLHKQREDNVSRHHLRVHGLAIRWKKGVAHPR